MDTDINYYKTKLNESKDNVVEQKLTASMYQQTLRTTGFNIINLIFIDNSQEESSNSSATGDFVFLNPSNGKLLIEFYYYRIYLYIYFFIVFNFYCRK